MSARFKLWEEMTRDERVEHVRGWIEYYEGRINRLRSDLFDAEKDLREQQDWLGRLLTEDEK